MEGTAARNRVRSAKKADDFIFDASEWMSQREDSDSKCQGSSSGICYMDC